MLVADFQTEKIAREVESANLATPIFQHLVGANRPADDLVEVFSRLVLAVDLLIPAERHRRTHQVDRVATFARCRRWQGLANGRVEGSSSKCGLREHGLLPPIRWSLAYETDDTREIQILCLRDIPEAE